jgi:hypothetical protein
MPVNAATGLPSLPLPFFSPPNALYGTPYDAVKTETGRKPRQTG